MKRLVKKIYPGSARAYRDLAIAAFIGTYVFVVTPGWVYFKHQTIFAVITHIAK